LGKKYNSSIEVFEPMTFMPIATITTDGGIGYMTFDSDQNILFALNRDKNTVNVVNPITREAIAEFDVGEAPYWISLMGER
jgi:hypothetical protein